MDLKDFDVVSGANEGFELQLVNYKTQEPLPLFVTVLGRDSDAFRRVQADQQRRRLAKMTKGNVVRVGSVSAEELEADAIDLLAACTVGWREELAPEGSAVPEGSRHEKKTLTVRGEELTCTRANAARLYADFPWIREQVDAAVGDRANFTQG